MVLPSIGFTLKQNENLELERLPSPEEQAMMMSLEYPSTVVPVDTSGKSFSRMSLLRRSLIHVCILIYIKKKILRLVAKYNCNKMNAICNSSVSIFS